MTLIIINPLHSRVAHPHIGALINCKFSFIKYGLHLCEIWVSPGRTPGTSLLRGLKLIWVTPTNRDFGTGFQNFRRASPLFF